MSNAAVQQIDLGFRVLGIDQVEYAVEGVRGKTYGQAVGLASILRAVAIESGIDGYVSIIRARERKVKDLSDILAVLSGTRSQYDTNQADDKSYNEEEYAIQFTGVYQSESAFADALKQYDITFGGWKGAGNKISVAELDKIKSEVEYQSQNEDTDLQSDLATLQSYVSKRDSAYSTASEMQGKCDRSISSQMKYMLG